MNPGRLLSRILVTFALLAAGCAPRIDRGSDYDTALWRLPDEQRKYFEEARFNHFEHLDSLVTFVHVYNELSALNEDLHIFQIRQKYMLDFAYAYDGDTASVCRLERAMDSSDELEVLHLFSGLLCFDTSRAYRGLEKQLDKALPSDKRQLYRTTLVREREYRWKKQKAAPTQRVEPRVMKTEPSVHTAKEIDSVLQLGLPLKDKSEMGFKKRFEILDSALTSADKERYVKARKTLIDFFFANPHDSVRTFEGFAERLLMIPAAGDPVIDTNQIRSVLRQLQPMFCKKKVMGVEPTRPGCSPELPHAVEIDNSIDSLVCTQLCVDAFPIGQYKEIQAFANRNGDVVNYQVNLSVCDGFADFSVLTHRIIPFWAATGLSTGWGGTSFHLRYEKGNWVKWGTEIRTMAD